MNNSENRHDRVTGKPIDNHYSEWKTRTKRPSGWKKDAAGNLTEPRGRRWRVKYQLDGARRAEDFDRKDEAENRIAQLQAEFRDGSHVDRRKSSTTVATVADAWLKSLVIDKSASTQKNYASILNNHVTPVWGTRELGAITHGDVVSWVADLKGSGLSAATVHRCYVVLSGILDYAVADGRLRGNPAAKVKLPKVDDGGDVFLSAEEVDRMARAADYLAMLRTNRSRVGRDRDAELTLDRDDNGVPVIPPAPASPDGLLIRFAAYSGLRVGELSGLQVRDLDLAKGLIHVRRANTEVAGRLVPGLPKGDKVRDVELAPHLANDLRAHVAGRVATDPVFVGATGAPIRRSNLNKRVIIPAAGLSGVSSADRVVTIHALRHTFASLCASAGVRIEIVSRWMGHASVAITQRVYVGLFREDLAASAGLLSAVATAVTPATPTLRVVGE
ncbi:MULTISPECIES: tyrosine-type recombinase/integrase [Gordonia]|uniref:Tyrosine-type recombinase/integrase n=1 Tax=Gordonia amicalis TaxID=89053 RepID=A0AAE4QZS3_9ACTN|nr:MULTISPECIES: site-specific integrase [Gordonia]MCZ4577775.1 tyrosine-type recombinase/integrase [Gordonia amicalis]MCZ4652395.1 tyrosine-type recombinase/integrase [Gordonia amicalis]MDJ0451230.1 tyrosine-type recombinase/integrase [Gordonia amicalis]MDV6310599.1 tyrosine-type recombinase/integrase [Gordonia amicalis]MDV7074612.1 tyrosine-type recombinase/integrase [Gordonia amicalis]